MSKLNLNRFASEITVLRASRCGTSPGVQRHGLDVLVAEMRATKPAPLSKSAIARIWRRIEGRIAWGWS